jgi:hypothetical protein
MKDLVFHLTHRPGEIGRIANILGRAGVNVKSMAAMTFGGQGVVRIIPDNADSARAALHDANIRFEESELLTVLVENQAGELANVADKLANANINIHAAYVVGLEGDLVDIAFSVDDVKKAKKLFE